MAQIIDGYCDFDNVTGDMVARHNISLYGTGDYVLQVDECLGYELVSNNEIHVKDGMFVIQGRRGCIKKGTTDMCIIENGAQAVNRNDIIVIEYAKDETTMLETHTTKVIKGTAAEEAVDPEIVTGDINDGAILHQMPLYRVKIEGLNVVAVEQMFEIGSVAVETVDPMEATEEGFAADAYKTKLQFDEQNKNIADYLPLAGGTLSGKLYSSEGALIGDCNNLSGAVNFNDYYRNGNYYLTYQSHTNAPIVDSAGKVNGFLYVFGQNNNQYCVQEFVQALSAGNNDHKVYRRKLVGALWSDWYQVYTTNQVTCGTTDLTAGSSSLGNDCIYHVYS